MKEDSKYGNMILDEDFWTKRSTKDIRIAVVDHRDIRRKGTLIVLGRLPFKLVFQTENGHAMKGLLDENNLPHVILINIEAPGDDGLRCTRWLKEHYPSVRVLALTFFTNQDLISSMVEDGVRGYVYHSADWEELKRAIMRVHKKGYYEPGPGDRLVGQIRGQFSGQIDEWEDDVFIRLMKRFRKWTKIE